MANYTKKNLNQDIEDAAKKFGVAGHEMHAASRELGLTQLGVSYQKTEPNYRAPFGHHHTEQEEVYVVIRGSGKMKVDDEIIELTVLDAVRVGKESIRQIQAGPDGIEFIAVGAPVTGNDKGELHPEWWSE